MEAHGRSISSMGYPPDMKDLILFSGRQRRNIQFSMPHHHSMHQVQSLCTNNGSRIYSHNEKMAESPVPPNPAPVLMD
eukprot:1147343-Pelagomonas_calceolata.AAC.4